MGCIACLHCAARASMKAEVRVRVDRSESSAPAEVPCNRARLVIHFSRIPCLRTSDQSCTPKFPGRGPWQIQQRKNAPLTSLPRRAKPQLPSSPCFILFWRLRCRLIGRGSPHSTTDDTLVLYVCGLSGLLGVASQLVAALWDCHWTLGEESTQGRTEAETDEREAIVCVTK